jgi:hypothetical protein
VIDRDKCETHYAYKSKINQPTFNEKNITVIGAKLAVEY